jgi:hypothetical protein
MIERSSIEHQVGVWWACDEDESALVTGFRAFYRSKSPVHFSAELEKVESALQADIEADFQNLTSIRRFLVKGNVN